MIPVKVYTLSAEEKQLESAGALPEGSGEYVDALLDPDQIACAYDAGPYARVILQGGKELDLKMSFEALSHRLGSTS